LLFFLRPFHAKVCTSIYLYKVLNMRYFFILILITLSACSFVEQKPGSENVVVTTKDQVASCASIGKSRVTVLSEIGFADLMESYVAEKLDLMGKNAGIDQGGNTVVKLEEPEPGVAVYGIYKCK
jgi:hypothetical protein